MVAESGRLSNEARTLLEDCANESLFSAASGWEIAIKHELGKLVLPDFPSRYVPRQIEETRVTPLAVEFAHALRVAELPAHHRDPFDHLLIAQAMIEEAVLVTSDPSFEPYGVETVAAGR